MRLSDPAGIRRERYPLHIEAVDSEELARSVRASLEATARRSGIEIVLLTPIGEAVPLVAADRKLLQQVLMNLCSNAIEYNRLNGKVRIRIAQPGQGRVRIAVTDTGIGICPDQQARLFELAPALQAHSGTERAGGGLAMTKWWVEQLGGELALWSEVGSGSTFWVDLPVHCA
jgi:signal transduction histidine kinase